MSEKRNQSLANSAFKRAQEAYRQGLVREVSCRKEALQKLEKTLRAREEDLLKALCLDLGKPGLEAWLAEYRFILDDIKLAVKNLNRWTKPQRVPTPFFAWPGRSWESREAYGTVLIFAPWNYPIQLALSPLIGAIAAGNTVILKPSEISPNVSQLLTEIIEEAFESGHVSALQGDASLAEELLTLPFDLIFFTGNHHNGRKVAKAAADHLAPCILELGGKCPVIIDETADPDLTVERIVQMKLFNAGQTCFSPDYLLVPDGSQEQWVQRLEEAMISELERGGDSDFGKIVNKSHYERLTKLANDHPPLLKDRPKERHFSPRVIATDREHPSMQDEIFGPILPVLGYGKDLIDDLKTLDSPLALYLFSKDDRFIQNVTEALRSGGVGINDLGKHGMNLHLPFGGVGASGYGRYRGHSTFEAFTYSRGFTKRYFIKDLFALKRPYQKTFEMLHRFMK